MTHLLLYEMPGFIRDNQELIVTIIIGAIAGYLAEFILPGRGFGLLVTILIGIVGGWLGDMFLGKYVRITHNALIDEIICATIGAMILVLIINLVLGRRKEGKDEKDIYDWGNE